METYATRFERRVPWDPLKYSRAHETLWQFLSTASLAFGAWYIGWRWLYSINPDAIFFSLLLLVAETAAYIGLILFTVNLWTDSAPVRPPLPKTLRDIVEGDSDDATDRPLAVDLFFTTYNEDPELVRLGLRDAKRITYPHPIDIRIHVLDDGKRPAMETVAQEEGVGYVTRSDNVGYKAGNLRNALEVTSGDLVAIFDADTRPFPTILEETLGYFRDPKMAWVQTPQWFCDIPPGIPLSAVLERRLGRVGTLIGRSAERVFGPVRIGEDPFANDPQLFYDVIQRRRNKANASFCCGAASIHRREAVMEAALRQWSDRITALSKLGEHATRKLTREEALSPAVRDTIRWQTAIEEEFTPYKFHVSEDIYTSIILHADRERGWKSVLHPVVQSRMLSPNDLLSWTIQRFKYAGGSLDILFHDNPLFRRKGLRLSQRVMYASTFYPYLSPLWNLVFIAAPIIFLFTGIAPISGYTLDFYLHIGPFLVLNELAQMVAMWGVSVSRGRAWYLAILPLNLKALWTVIMRRKVAFPVTPKDRQEGVFPRLVRFQIAVIVLTLLALAWGWFAFSIALAGYTIGAMIANTLWGLNNVYSMSPIVRAAFWHPDPVYEQPILEEASR